MKLSLFTVALFISHCLMAQSSSEKWTPIIEKCFQEITPKTKCPISEREDLFQSVKDITYWTYEMNREFNRFNQRCEDKDSSIKGQAIKNQIVKQLKSQIKANKLSRCQQACAVNCFSSHFLEEKNFFGRQPVEDHGKQHGLFEVYKIQAGECTEFARINEDLLEALEFETKVSAVGPTKNKPGHAFTSVKVNGTWYHMNTPISECIFYRTRSRGEIRTEQEWIDNTPGNEKGGIINNKKNNSPTVGN